jgi:4-hydroxy-tetrahydrodipicolinate reductase
VLRVAIVGGAGRMGQTMACALSENLDMSVVALVDPREPENQGTAAWARSLDELAVELDVVVDFTTIDVARRTISWCLEHNVAAVVGTSGFSAGELAELAARVEDSAGRVIIAANFSIGAVLAERFAATAAPYFDRAEIIELHHDKKVDAPSGTSLAAARAIAAARADAGLGSIEDATELETAAHARGADGLGGVRVHSVRLPGLVAHQEVIFGRPGEGLTIRHDSYDRSSFVGGVALAVRAIGDRPGLTVGLSELLGR